GVQTCALPICRHSRRNQRGNAQDRDLSHHLDFWPPHGACGWHGDGAVARRICPVSQFFITTSGEEICCRDGTCCDCRLSPDFGSGRGGRTQLHHACGHAAGRTVRQGRAHHSQPRNLDRKSVG